MNGRQKRKLAELAWENMRRREPWGVVSGEIDQMLDDDDNDPDNGDAGLDEALDEIAENMKQKNNVSPPADPPKPAKPATPAGASAAREIIFEDD